MRSAIILCVNVVLHLLFLKFSEASLTSKCAVNNTAVDFHCNNAYSWRVNYVPPWPAAEEVHENVSITADLTNEHNNGSVSLVQCISRTHEGDDYHLAVVVIADPSNPVLPVFPVLYPASRSSLGLFWESPVYENNPYPYYDYTVTLSGADGYMQTFSVFVNATELPTLTLDLSGHECEEIEIHISLPGNCEPMKLTGSLLTDPTYPMAHDLEIIALNTTSVGLMWQHPENILNEVYFNYSITATVVSNGSVMEHYTIAISSNESPWQVFDLSGIGVCEEVNFTVSLVGDCRKIWVVAALEILPTQFASEIIDAKSLFSNEDPNLQKLEIAFEPPELCTNQVAHYILTFNNMDENTTWSTNKTRMLASTQPVEIEIAPERLELERSYEVTVTIVTILGNISSSSSKIFNTCPCVGGAPTELVVQAIGYEGVQLTWLHPCCTLAPSYTYAVTASLVSSGEVILEEIFPVLQTVSPLVQLSLKGYGCKDFNYSVSLYGGERKVFTVDILPAYATEFTENVEATSSFNKDGTIKEVEVVFTPPMLCEFQTAAYVLTFNDGNVTWSTTSKEISDTHQQVEEDIDMGLDRDKNYTVTVTVTTDYGNITSSTTFNTCFIVGGAPSQLVVQPLSNDGVQLTWLNPCDLFVPSFTYNITAVLVNSGEVILRDNVMVLRNEAPTTKLSLAGSACKSINYTVSLYGEEGAVSTVEVLPAYPMAFTQGVEITTEDDAMKVMFTPPSLCEFQTASYMLTYTDGNETWSTDVKEIIDTNQQVIDVLETGFEINKNYTVTATVITQYGHITSNGTFIARYPQIPPTTSISVAHMNRNTSVGGSGVQAYIIVIIVLMTLTCGFMSGVAVVCFLRQRKLRIKKSKEDFKKKQGPMVVNPLYEATEDHYEHLPEPRPVFLSTTLPVTGESCYTDVGPALPPPRFIASSTGENCPHDGEKMEKRIPTEMSVGDISACSLEDCYTVMSPAGTLTVLPRNRNSASVSASGTDCASASENKNISDII